MLMEDHHDLLAIGYFDRKQLGLLRETYHGALREVRPHALHLVEFCPYLEDSIVSTIGNKYGDIHEAVLETAKFSKLN